jgi:glycosyltransferase involved in cell wall biosynthesis
MIEDGVSGVLVRPGDAAALADAIQALLEDPARRARLGAAARARVATAFSVERMVDEMDALYREVVG